MVLRIGPVPVWVAPSELVASARAVLGWTDDAVELVAALPARVTGLLDEVDGLLLRVSRAVQDVERLVGEVGEVAAGAATVLVRADAVADGAAGVVEGLGLGHNSIVHMIESQAHYVIEALRGMSRSGAWAAEPRTEAQEAYAELNALAGLRSGRPESIETSAIHLDIIRDLKRIHGHLTAVVYPILEAGGEPSGGDYDVQTRPYGTKVIGYMREFAKQGLDQR